MPITQAIILCAGKGTRMGELGKQTPKPMLKHEGRIILETKLEALPKSITDVVLVIGYLGNMIRDHFGNKYDERNITYVESKKFDGPGRALIDAQHLVHDSFLSMMGDDLYATEDIEAVMRYDWAISGFEVRNNDIYGIIRTKEDGTFLTIDDRVQYVDHAFINTGLYALKKEFFEYEMVPSLASGQLSIGETLQMVAKNHHIGIVPAKGWYKITYPEDLK